jgi:hypothetical protein
MGSLSERSASIKKAGLEVQETPEYLELSNLTYQILFLTSRQRDLQQKVLYMAQQRLERIPRTKGVRERLEHELHIIGAAGLLKAVDDMAEDKL